jgi:hypothetical protein
MFGIDETKMWAPDGNPDSSVDTVLWKSDWNVEVGVIVETDEVQTSFAPMRIVTYWACWLIALCAWTPVSATVAPDTASS